MCIFSSAVNLNKSLIIFNMIQVIYEFNDKNNYTNKNQIISNFKNLPVIQTVSTAWRPYK